MKPTDEFFKEQAAKSTASLPPSEVLKELFLKQTTNATNAANAAKQVLLPPDEVRVNLNSTD